MSFVNSENGGNILSLNTGNIIHTLQFGGQWTGILGDVRINGGGNTQCAHFILEIGTPTRTTALLAKGCFNFYIRCLISLIFNFRCWTFWVQFIILIVLCVPSVFTNAAFHLSVLELHGFDSSKWKSVDSFILFTTYVGQLCGFVHLIGPVSHVRCWGVWLVVFVVCRCSSCSITMACDCAAITLHTGVVAVLW